VAVADTSHPLGEDHFDGMISLRRLPAGIDLEFNGISSHLFLWWELAIMLR